VRCKSLEDIIIAKREITSLKCHSDSISQISCSGCAPKVVAIFSLDLFQIFIGHSVAQVRERLDDPRDIRKVFLSFAWTTLWILRRPNLSSQDIV
jgi:hypothetical protein